MTTPAASAVPSPRLPAPVRDGGLSRWWINQLPAYRRGLTPFRRGLEVGMAHGYWLLGPFVKLGPLRDTTHANFFGLIATLGLLAIATASLALYAASEPPVPRPTPWTPHIPDAFTSRKGWNAYTTGWLVGSLGGAIVAYLVLLVVGFTQFFFGL